MLSSVSAFTHVGRQRGMIFYFDSGQTHLLFHFTLLQDSLSIPVALSAATTDYLEVAQQRTMNDKRTKARLLHLLLQTKQLYYRINLISLLRIIELP